VDPAVSSKVDQVIATFRLEEACSVTDVLAAVARHRGRDLTLQPLPARADFGHLFGLCLPYPDRDVILFRTGAGVSHELHSTLHECGHLLLDHIPAVARSSATDSTIALLLPDLDAGLIREALARSSYEDRQEQEAETFAMTMRRVLETQQLRRCDVVLSRFDNALD